MQATKLDCGLPKFKIRRVFYDKKNVSEKVEKGETQETKLGFEQASGNNRIWVAKFQIKKRELSYNWETSLRNVAKGKRQKSS